MTRARGLIALLGCVAAAAAVASSPYAWQWPLTLARDDSGIHQVALERQVYESAVDPGLGDLDVLDAQGHPVPSLLQAPSGTTIGDQRSVPLPWFPAPATAPSGTPPRWRIRAETAAGPGLHRLETEVLEPAAGPSSITDTVIDASGVDERIESLELDWPAGASVVDARYRLDGSDDLNQWTPLREGRLLDLDNQGHRIRQQRIELGDSRQARYYRVRPLDTGSWPPIDGVQARLQPARGSTPPQWLALTARAASTTAAGSQFEFENPGRFLVAIVDVQVANNSTGEWSLESRDQPDQPWRRRLPARVYYQLNDAGQGSRSAPASLDGSHRDRYWRLLSPTTGVHEAPVLRLGFRPEALVFLAQGDAPFTLVAGSATARRARAPVAEVLASQRARHGADWTPPLATPGERAVRDGDTALRPPADAAGRDWQTWLLWAVLVLGAALVAGLALSLLRRAGNA